MALVLVFGTFFTPASVFLAIFFAPGEHTILATWASWSVFAVWIVGLLIVVSDDDMERRR